MRPARDATDTSLEMVTHLLTKPRTILGVGLLAAIMAAGAYAFAASNTVPDSHAGSGSGAVSGYTASGITYTLNATDPSKVDHVLFALDPTSTGTVKVRADGSNWVTCPNDGSGNIDCDYSSSPIALSSISNLDVVAVG